MASTNRDPVTLVEVLRWRSRWQAARQAYTFLLDGDAAEAHLSYSELDRWARSVGAALQSRNAVGERVVLLCPPGLEYIATFFGCMYAGAVPVPAYLPHARQLHCSLQRLRAIMKDADARLVVASPEIAARVRRFRGDPGSPDGLDWISTEELKSVSPESWTEPKLKGDSLALLQYTSGATGDPKGAMLTHEHLLHNLSLILKCFRLGAESKGVIWLPPYHDMGLIGGVLEPVYGGFPVILMSPLRFIQRPGRWLRAISRYGASVSGGPNFAYELCISKTTREQRAGLRLESWQVAFNGAEPVRSETLDRFVAAFADHGFRRTAFYPCYGLAEATLFVTGPGGSHVVRVFDKRGLEQGRVAPSLAQSRRTTRHDSEAHLVSCGKTWGDEKIVIVDPNNRRRCAPNRIGEVWISGDSVAKGYWNRPRDTLEIFQARLADTGEGPFLRTGDLGFLHEGELFMTGRLKELIIVRGRNHVPQDIERTVERSHPCLLAGNGAAFAVDKEGGERLVVVQAVERRHLPTLDVEQVKLDIAEAVARDHGLKPYEIVLVKPGAIPKTSSGKIMRGVCRARFLAGGFEALGGGNVSERRADRAAVLIEGTSRG